MKSKVQNETLLNIQEPNMSKYNFGIFGSFTSSCEKG